MNYIIGLTVTGILSGLMAGVIGAGAEIIVVPLLTMFGIVTSLKMRIGTSLCMLLPPIGLLAMIKYYKEGHVDMKAGLYMSVIFMIFSYLSSQYSVNMDTASLQKIFGIITIATGIYIYFHKEA